MTSWSQVFFLLLIATLVPTCSEQNTYARHCAAPLSHWRLPADGINHDAITNRVRISDTGALSWNGVPVSEDTLRRYMEISRELEPLPFAILDVDAHAPCTKVHRIRAQMNRVYCNWRWACGEGTGKWAPALDLPDAKELERIGKIADDALEKAGKRENN
jgi:hypothetical protein